MEKHPTQSGAGIKSIVPDAGDSPWNGHIGDARTTRKRPVANARNGAGDWIITGPAAWVFNQRGLTLIEQNPAHTAIKWIRIRHSDVCNVEAGTEHQTPHAGDAVGKQNISQIGAAIERPIPDTGDVRRNRDIHEACAAIERRIANTRDTIGNRAQV